MCGSMYHSWYFVGSHVVIKLTKAHPEDDARVMDHICNTRKFILSVGDVQYACSHPKIHTSCIALRLHDMAINISTKAISTQILSHLYLQQWRPKCVHITNSPISKVFVREFSAIRLMVRTHCRLLYNITSERTYNAFRFFLIFAKRRAISRTGETRRTWRYVRAHQCIGAFSG